MSNLLNKIEGKLQITTFLVTKRKNLTNRISKKTLKTFIISLLKKPALSSYTSVGTLIIKQSHNANQFFRV